MDVCWWASRRWLPLTVLFVVYCGRVEAQLDLKPFTRPYNIHEDTLVETPIARVDCTNPGDYCLCNVKSSYPVDGPFTVWKKTQFSDFYAYYTGVANGQHLSFRNNPTYFLTIECHDTTGTEVNQTVLEIDVQQNQAPRFTNPKYPKDAITLDAQQPVPANTFVYNVTATDEENDPLTYSITTKPPVNYFSIGYADGFIKTTTDLRTATVDHVIMVVSVTDGINTVDNFDIIITIANLNTRPEISNLPQTVTIPETTASGATITTLSMNDPDIYVRDLVPVCTVAPDAEQYKFTYEPGTRKIRVSTLANAAMPFDYERINLYTITCVVTDGFLESQNDVLTVKIENVNEPPYFDELSYYCDLYESNAGVSTCDLDAVITDPEGDRIVSVGFMKGNNSERFRYDRSSSAVTFTVDYDVDQNLMPTSLVLQLQATDVYGASSNVPVYVRVRDVNDNTCDFGPTSVRTFKADQGTQLGSLGSFIATDNDLTSPNNLVSYQVVQSNPADSSNYIAAYSDGSLGYIGTIPPENSGRSYSLAVVCKDGGTPQRSATGTIVLTYQTTTTTSTTTTTTPTTTTTTTTTTPTTTTTTTTTTQKPGIFDNDAFVAVFAILMSLVVLGSLVGLYFLLRACGLFGGSTVAPAVVDGAEEAAEAAAPAASRGLCGPNNGCSDFCCPKPPPPKKDDYFNMEVKANNDFRDYYWNKGDNYESGTGYKPEGGSYGKSLDFGPRRLALPAPRSLKRY